MTSSVETLERNNQPRENALKNKARCQTLTVSLVMLMVFLSEINTYQMMRKKIKEQCALVGLTVIDLGDPIKDLNLFREDYQIIKISYYF